MCIYFEVPGLCSSFFSGQHEVPAFCWFKRSGKYNKVSIRRGRTWKENHMASIGASLQNTTGMVVLILYFVEEFSEHEHQSFRDLKVAEMLSFHQIFVKPSGQTHGTNRTELRFLRWSLPAYSRQPNPGKIPVQVEHQHIDDARLKTLVFQWPVPPFLLFWRVVGKVLDMSRQS